MGLLGGDILPANLGPGIVDPKVDAGARSGSSISGTVAHTSILTASAQSHGVISATNSVRGVLDPPASASGSLKVGINTSFGFLTANGISGNTFDVADPLAAYDEITYATPNSTLTNFSVPIRTTNLTASWAALVDTTDGTKGRAFLDDGTTELATDWIDIDAANGEWLVRIKVPTRTSTDTSKIRLYPPRAARTSYAFSDTYGAGNAYSADLVAYHPDGGPFDRISNSNTLSLVGSPAPSVVSGPLGNATQYIDGSTGFYRGTLPAGAAALPRSGVGWCQGNVAADSAQADILTLARAAARTTDYEWYYHKWAGAGNDTNRVGYAEGGVGSAVVARFTGSTDNDNHFLAGLRPASNNTTMYGGLDGDADLSSSVVITTDIDPTGLDEYAIGGSVFASTGNGIIWNNQLWGSGLSADWVEYEFDATKDNASFITTVTHVAV